MKQLVNDEDIYITGENNNMDSEVTRGGELIALPSSNDELEYQPIVRDELRVGNVLSLRAEQLKHLWM